MTSIINLSLRKEELAFVIVALSKANVSGAQEAQNLLHCIALLKSAHDKVPDSPKEKPKAESKAKN